MAQILGLPKLSPTMEEGVLVRWTKKEGDKVSPGDLIAEVETDKANMDFNVEDEGVLLKLLVKEGDTVRLGAPVAVIGNAGEDIAALLEQAKSDGAPKAAPAKAAAKEAPKPAAKEAPKPAAAKAAPAKAAPAKAAKAAPADEADVDEGAEDVAPAAKKPDDKGSKAAKPAANPAAPAGRLLASPLAKTLAIELGIDLRNVTGSGPGGRIVERDVKAAADGGAPAQADAGDEPEAEAEDHAEVAEAAPAKSQALAVRPAVTARPAALDADTDYEDVPASNMRKRIAARLTEAKRDVPHFYLMRDLDAAALNAYRLRLNELMGDRGKVSVNDLVIKAAAIALRRLPDCNASWQGDAIRHFHRVHIGVAVAIPDGLVTPVIRDADQKGIGSIAAEVKDLAERAKNRGLKAHEISGSTFSVSNLGMFGIERFTAILNPPEAGILAVGAVRDVAVVDVRGTPPDGSAPGGGRGSIDKGAVVAGKRMAVTMSCDHRVIDGALGARWLQVFAELIEKPESLAL